MGRSLPIIAMDGAPSGHLWSVHAFRFAWAFRRLHKLTAANR